MLPVEKYSRREEVTNVVSSTNVTHVPYRNHEASSEKLWFVRSLYQNLSQIGKKITTACWCHFMTPCQVSGISHKFWIYRNLETKFLNVFSRSRTPRCLEFIAISCMGPKHAPQGHIYDFSTHFGALDHVPVVQIWMVHIKCLENSVIVQKCPNEPWITPNFNTTLLLIHVAYRKIF